MTVHARSARFGAAALLLLTGLLAACTGSSTPSPTSPTSSPPAATPPPASQGPSAQPSGSSGPGFHVELSNATDDDVTIDVTDASGTLTGAESGTPGDGASVEPYVLQVANDDPSTLRLTWVGGPCDSANTLSIDPTRRQFLLVQPECPGDTLVSDRVLILRFSQPIAATDVQPSLQDGVDTEY